MGLDDFMKDTQKKYNIFGLLYCRANENNTTNAI